MLNDDHDDDECCYEQQHQTIYCMYYILYYIYAYFLYVINVRMWAEALQPWVLGRPKSQSLAQTEERVPETTTPSPEATS